MNLEKTFFSYSNLTSWEKSYRNLLRLQLRLYKSFLVQDISRALYLQKILIASKSTRLLSIRDVTQIDSYKRIAGIDGQAYLNFTERFLLSEKLKLSVNNWFPKSLKCIKIIGKDGLISFFNVSTVSDRCWQVMVKYCLEPSHEAFFSPNNFGYRSYISIHDLQKSFFRVLEPNSFGKQKRILCVDLVSCFDRVDYRALLRKLLVPRSIKIGIFRTLNLGYNPRFGEYFLKLLDFGSLLANIMLDGIENLRD